MTRAADRGEYCQADEVAAQDLMPGQVYNGVAVVSRDGEHHAMQQLYLAIFVASMTALVVCGCIMTRKPTKKPSTKIWRPAVPNEHQPSCFGLEEERGGDWKGSGGSVPAIKEAKPSL